MKLSQSLEDYLEIIYLLKKEKKDVRVKDIAFHLNVSLPSVTEMMQKLANKNFIKYKRYGPIELTHDGEERAKKIYKKHKLLVDFFMLLGVDEKTAVHDACLAEHILSKKTLSRIKKFVRGRN